MISQFIFKQYRPVFQISRRFPLAVLKLRTCVGARITLVSFINKTTTILSGHN